MSQEVKALIIRRGNNAVIHGTHYCLSTRLAGAAGKGRDKTPTDASSASRVRGKKRMLLGEGKPSCAVPGRAGEACDILLR